MESRDGGLGSRKENKEQGRKIWSHTANKNGGDPYPYNSETVRKVICG